MSFNYFCSGSTYKEHLEGGGWTLKERNCQFCTKGALILDENSNEFSCPNDEAISLKLMGENCSGRTTPQMSMAEVKAERLQRSRDHFKKEVFHTLDSDGQRHHVRKGTGLVPSVNITLPSVSAGAKKEIKKKVSKR